jgi:hypothetical protein
MRQPSPSRCSLLHTSRTVPGIDAGRQIYSRQIVCSCSEDQNLSRAKHVLHRQSGEDSRIGCQAGMLLHQLAGDGAAQSKAKGCAV